MASIPNTSDGDYDQLLLVAPTKTERPFSNYVPKDTSTKFYERTYELMRDAFTPASSAMTLPNEGAGDDGADASAYLISESEKPDVQPDGSQTVVRRFANIPGTKTVACSVPYTRPVFPSTTFNGYVVSTVDPGTIAKIYGQLRALSSEQYMVTGGSFTLTINGSTTAALAWNASAATVRTAIIALGLGNCTVTGTAGSHYVIETGSVGGGFVTTSISIDVTGLTQPYSDGIIGSAAVVNGGGNSTSNVYFRRKYSYFTSAAHGLSLGTTGIINGDPLGLITPIVPDSNTLAFIAPDASTTTLTFNTAPYTSYYPYIRDYLPGPAILSGQKLEKYYIPGAPGQPATADLIPITTSNLSDTAFLLAVCQGGTVWFTSAFAGPDPYDGQMLRTVETQMLAS